MSPAHVLQPTYERLKREVIQGDWAQNVKLEAARIAEDYGVSATPVRDSLNLLVGEGLITFRPGEGYRTRVITERDLKELLSINMMLLQFAVDTATAGVTADGQQEFVGGDEYAGAVGKFFREVAQTSGNRVLAELVGRLNDRLHHMRTYEHLVLADLDAELAELLRSFSIRPAAAKDELAAYHDRRITKVGALAASLQ